MTFSEYARAKGGILQALVGIGKLRVSPPCMVGPPKVPVALRVSAILQGVTPIKVSGV